MNNPNSDDLAQIYRAKVESGLLDAKFLLRPNEEVGTEEICREVVSFNHAIAEGRTEPLDFGDLQWKEVD